MPILIQLRYGASPVCIDSKNKAQVPYTANLKDNK